VSNNIWKQKWRRNDIAFHQSTFSPLLQHYLPQRKLVNGDTILVPLCGKSHDMDLLADSGYQVMGVELSSIAIEAYFDARKVSPSKSKKGSFTVWQHKNIVLWCGDIFDLSRRTLNNIKMMYDCASLTAFPVEQRSRYMYHFAKILPLQASIMLLTIESPETGHNSQNVIDAELKKLYETHYKISLLYGESCLKIDPEDPLAAACLMEEKLYLLENRGC
jgi:thiopurine S-methyltransferase